MSTEPVTRTVPSVALRNESNAAATMVLDLVCDSRTREIAVKTAADWCQLRPIPASAAERATTLLREAASYGLGFNPRRLRLRIGWVDQRRIWVALTWHACSDGTARSTRDLERTAETFEHLACAWGFGAGRATQTHWFVVDVSR